MKKHLLFVSRNLNIGGPQKSLIALFDNFDYSKYSVDVFLVERGTILEEYINKNVNIIYAEKLFSAILLEKATFIHSIKFLFTHGYFQILTFALWYILFRNGLFNMNRVRQYLFMKFGKYLKNADGTYDAAFGITDSIMTYFIVDKVNARKKYHWVRSDYRILNLDKCVEEAYFSNLNGVLAVSKTCADIFVDEFPVFKNRIYVFRNYIPIKYYSSLRYDSSLIDKNDGCIRIGSVCRLDPLKGIELSIDACRKLLDGGYKVKWYIIGGGPQEYAIRKQIESYRVNDNFILLGFRKNVYSYLKDFDIFVLSSRTEGRSNAVDEAIACNLPIVVTHYPTVGDQITDKRNGLICELNGDSISKSVGLLIDNYPLRQFLINNCKSQNNSDTNNSIKIFESLT